MLPTMYVFADYISFSLLVAASKTLGCMLYLQAGMTALMISIKEQNEAATSFLLNRGADFNATDRVRT